MQLSFCRLRTHQLCFLCFNVVLFHALLFGGDFVEEFLLQPSPRTYTDARVLQVRERARKLDMSSDQARINVSQHFIISNSGTCGGQDVFLLALVLSGAENGSRRHEIRNTWANLSQVAGFTTRTLFLLGLSPGSQNAVLQEAARYGDIIQTHINDSSHSLTSKTFLGMEWVVTFCPFARFVLHTEESAFVNLQSLGEYLLSLHRHPEDLYVGRVVHQHRLPDYCQRPAFLLSQDVVRKVYVAWAELTSLPPASHDMLVGACAQRAGVLPTHSPRFSGERHIRYNACCYRFLFSSAHVELEKLAEIWRELQDGGACNLLETYSGLVACKVLTYLDKFSFFSSGATGEHN